MPEQIDAARVKESSHEVFQKWFADMKSIIDEYDIQPCDVYNMDETGFSIGSIKVTHVKIGRAHV